MTPSSPPVRVEGGAERERPDDHEAAEDDGRVQAEHCVFPAAAMSAREQEQPGEQQRVEAEVADVGDGRVGVDAPDRVEPEPGDVPPGLEDHRGSDEPPGTAGARVGLRGAGAADREHGGGSADGDVRRVGDDETLVPGRTGQEVPGEVGHEVAGEHEGRNADPPRGRASRPRPRQPPQPPQRPAGVAAVGSARMCPCPFPAT